MSNCKLSTKKMVAKSKNKVLCSTPEHRLCSPSRDSDSESASPVPFLCTQDGAEGEIDVVWNYYTPKSETAKSRFKNSTPVSRRVKKTIPPTAIEKPLPKRRAVKPSQKKTEFIQELIELNQNLHEYAKKPSITTVGNKPQSEEDIFSDASDSSPRSCVRSKNRCLRKNILSSKFTKVEQENGLESDDSMNECLLKASQAVEENVLNIQSKLAKRSTFEPRIKNMKPNLNVNIDNDSMDAILNNIRLESPSITRMKKFDSTRLNNDSFDSVLCNINDSAIEELSQLPLKNEFNKSSSNTKGSNWMLKELVVCDGSPSTSKSIFGRYSSMPESPTVTDTNRPSTSGMVLGRYSSMPFNKSDEKITGLGDSPIRCTPDEIKKKHQQAREKLLAKRLLPFTTSQQTNPTSLSSQNKPIAKKTSFQLRVPSSKIISNINSTDKKIDAEVNMKLIIEKKRQEALMKLRKRLPQSK